MRPNVFTWTIVTLYTVQSFLLLMKLSCYKRSLEICTIARGLEPTSSPVCEKPETRAYAQKAFQKETILTNPRPVHFTNKLCVLGQET